MTTMRLINADTLISIHAPREGGDSVDTYRVRAGRYFNPRPPRRGRHRIKTGFKLLILFQSTPPARGATASDIGLSCKIPNFNPRPPRGGRQCPCKSCCHLLYISIHAPREGGDVQRFINSTLSPPISIHAPREGGDLASGLPVRAGYHFNPRPPRGGRQQRCTVLPADL